MAPANSALVRANSVLRAHRLPFRLRAGHNSRWVSVYENLPGRRVRERAVRGVASQDELAIEELCFRLVSEARKQPEAGLDALLPAEDAPTPSLHRSGPCWPEICEAVVRFQRGQGVNMNLVGPFKGKGYFCLLPADQPATEEDVRRFAPYTSERLKARQEDPEQPLMPMATHRAAAGGLWRDRPAGPERGAQGDGEPQEAGAGGGR